MTKKTKSEEIRAKFGFLFSTPEGKEVLEMILKKAAYGKCVFSSDRDANSFQQGVQSLAIWIKELTEQK